MTADTDAPVDPFDLFLNRITQDDVATVESFPGFKDFINRADDEGWTPMIWAACTGRNDIITLLKRHGADINHRAKNDETALMCAADTCDETCLMTLLRLGARTDFKNKDGDTAYDILKQHDKNDLAEKLNSFVAETSTVLDHAITVRAPLVLKPKRHSP